MKYNEYILMEAESGDPKKERKKEKGTNKIALVGCLPISQVDC